MHCDLQIMWDDRKGKPPLEGALHSDYINWTRSTENDREEWVSGW